MSEFFKDNDIDYNNKVDSTLNRKAERISRLNCLVNNGNQYQKKLTQQDLANKVRDIAGSCSVGTVNGWLKDGKFPNFEHLEALAIIYNVDIAYLLGETANCSTYTLESNNFTKATNLSGNAYIVLQKELKQSRKDSKYHDLFVEDEIKDLNDEHEIEKLKTDQNYPSTYLDFPTTRTKFVDFFICHSDKISKLIRDYENLLFEINDLNKHEDIEDIRRIAKDIVNNDKGRITDFLLERDREKFCDALTTYWANKEIDDFYKYATTPNTLFETMINDDIKKDVSCRVRYLEASHIFETLKREEAQLHGLEYQITKVFAEMVDEFVKQ